MALIDWLIVVIYFILTIVLGLVLSGKASQSLEDFFVSGRSLSWWLAGTSMAATRARFSVDFTLVLVAD